MQINIVYVDDICDPQLSKYLDTKLENDLKSQGVSVSIASEDIIYEPATGYQNLLKNEKLQTANIAIIDSRLFGLDDADKGMLTGELVRILLRKYFPFLETLIVSSHKDALECNPAAIPKYAHFETPGKTADAFYSEKILEPIKNAIFSIIATRKAEEKLDTADIDSVVADKIRNSVLGLTEFDELKTADIDKAVAIFEDLKRLIVSVS